MVFVGCEWAPAGASDYCDFGVAGSVNGGEPRIEPPWQRGTPGLLVGMTSVECHLIRGVTHTKSEGFPDLVETSIEIEDDEQF